uniref:Expressed conserved protein n=1 Tax=Echinococcus granulosus TaxID=6210 RepID=A0A068WMP9_ECHGR|nr:expressed conserved protein [Echinococcus granulosus]
MYSLKLENIKPIIKQFVGSVLFSRGLCFHNSGKVPQMDCGDEVVDMRKRSLFHPTSELMANKRIKSSPFSPGDHADGEYMERQQMDSKPSSSLGEPISAETEFSEADENDDFAACEDDGTDRNQYLAAAPNPMDQALRELIRKYVRADYVIHCLELAGFDSAVVFACLNSETNIRQLETFVGATCALINSQKIRQYFLGPVYARHPTNFKLPAGVVCGLQLAVEELKRTGTFTTSPAVPFSTISDAATQTEVSSLGPSSLTSSSEGSPPDPAFANASDSSLIPPPAHISTENLSFHLPPPSLSTVESDCKRLFDCMGGRFSLPSQSQSHSPHSRSSSSTSVDNIDVERLIHHSSASACRLAARQFVNANLVRGQHFDMEMEVSGGGENGQKRVTGIFYCHLCREKRERTCAVRFSVARNRYPVMSNVLSHLKTHFQYQSSANAAAAAAPAAAPAVGTKKIVPPPPPSVSPSALIDSSAPTVASTESPFLSPNSFCNLVSRVVQFAASANPLPATEMRLPSQVPLGHSPSLPSKLSSLLCVCDDGDADDDDFDVGILPSYLYLCCTSLNFPTLCIVVLMSVFFMYIKQNAMHYIFFSFPEAAWLLFGGS